MTALIPVELNDHLSGNELREMMEAVEEQRARPEDFITDAIRAKLAERRTQKSEEQRTAALSGAAAHA